MIPVILRTQLLRGPVRHPFALPCPTDARWRRAGMTQEIQPRIRMHKAQSIRWRPTRQPSPLSPVARTRQDGYT